ncbi:hypothetical protein C8R45DRAFT_1030419 [Mycena sanguinolenta]|nr:hypothetical protein C8R45DRAFT_1030419 [Mycena sanguinolenta]
MYWIFWAILLGCGDANSVKNVLPSKSAQQRSKNWLYRQLEVAGGSRSVKTRSCIHPSWNRVTFLEYRSGESGTARL